ncbi:MAG: hypothetical protein WAM39_13390 [Bryobacteraceae bacterium]
MRRSTDEGLLGHDAVTSDNYHCEIVNLRVVADDGVMSDLQIPRDPHAHSTGN